MKLFSLLLASASATFEDPADKFPNDVHICDSEQHTKSHAVNGNFKKIDKAWINGKVAYEMVRPDHKGSLYIHWHAMSNSWLMSKALGGPTGFYQLAADDIFSKTVAWTRSGTEHNPVDPNGGEWAHSNMRAGYHFDCYCAVMYDKGLDNGNFRVILAGGDIYKLNGKTFSDNKFNWNNKASTVRVNKNCELKAYNKPNYRNLLGNFGGDDFALEGKLNNKMSSFSCSCYYNGRGCFDKYYGSPDVILDSGTEECPKPQCGEDNGVQFNVVDSWSSKDEQTHGFVASISVPEAESDDGSWTVVLRWDTAPNSYQGTFEAFNANFFGTFHKADFGLEMAFVPESGENANIDTTNENTFTLVGKNLQHSVKNKQPEIFLFRQASDNWNCYNPTVNGARSSQDPIIEKGQKIKKIRFGKGGNVKLFDRE